MHSTALMHACGSSGAHHGAASTPYSPAWEHRREREVNDRLEERLTTAWNDVVEYAGTHTLTYRQAATALAVRRVTQAHRQRGLYP